MCVRSTYPRLFAAIIAVMQVSVSVSSAARRIHVSLDLWQYRLSILVSAVVKSLSMP
jgi:hypothetical protein